MYKIDWEASSRDLTIKASYYSAHDPYVIIEIHVDVIKSQNTYCEAWNKFVQSSLQTIQRGKIFTVEFWLINNEEVAARYYQNLLPFVLSKLYIVSIIDCYRDFRAQILGNSRLTWEKFVFKHVPQSR